MGELPPVCSRCSPRFEVSCHADSFGLLEFRAASWLGPRLLLQRCPLGLVFWFEGCWRCWRGRVSPSHLAGCRASRLDRSARAPLLLPALAAVIVQSPSHIRALGLFVANAWLVSQDFYAANLAAKQHSAFKRNWSVPCTVFSYTTALASSFTVVQSRNERICG